MQKRELDKHLSRANEICARTGGRLTPKRKRILALLLSSPTPLSAYEVAESYNRDADTHMPAMSVYRILDFLVAGDLVHKLHSNSKYVACAHIACEHSHEVPQFLICRRCQTVKEIGIKRSIVEALAKHVREAGFTLMNSQLELDCLCQQCSPSEN